MDITAAEGLADLIEAETSLQRRQATARMQASLAVLSGFGARKSPGYLPIWKR